MICKMDAIKLQYLSVIENERFENSSHSILQWKNKCNISRKTSTLNMNCSSSSVKKRHNWRISLALDTGGFPSQENVNNENQSGGTTTRLGRIVSAGAKELLQKLNSARKNFPMKVFLLLLGFYTANALATILGQTGDWDVLVAGIVVAAIEGIGMLMYRRRPPMTGRFQSLILMINYWKAGVCLGLFVDAFKLGS